GPAELLVESGGIPSFKPAWSPQPPPLPPGTAALRPPADFDENGSGLPRWGEGIRESVRHITPYEARFFQEESAREQLLRHFEVASLEGFGCAHLPLAIRAAGALLAYLAETQRGVLEHLTALETYSTERFMVLDPHTRRNLELFQSG